MNNTLSRGRPLGSNTLSNVTVGYLLATFGNDAQVPVGTKFLALKKAVGVSVKAVDVLKAITDEQRTAASASRAIDAAVAALAAKQEKMAVDAARATAKTTAKAEKELVQAEKAAARAVKKLAKQESKASEATESGYESQPISIVAGD